MTKFETFIKGICILFLTLVAGSCLWSCSGIPATIKAPRTPEENMLVIPTTYTGYLMTSKVPYPDEFIKIGDKYYKLTEVL